MYEIVGKTREGRPLLTIENQANGIGDPRNINERWPPLVRWAPRADARDFFPALAVLVGPVQNISSPYT